MSSILPPAGNTPTIPVQELSIFLLKWAKELANAQTIEERDRCNESWIVQGKRQFGDLVMTSLEMYQLTVERVSFELRQPTRPDGSTTKKHRLSADQFNQFQ